MKITVKIILLFIIGILTLTVLIVFFFGQAFNNLDIVLSKTTDDLLTNDLTSKKEKDVKSLENYGQVLAQYLANITASPLWDFQTELVQEYANNLLKLRVKGNFALVF
jgi:hypothetical protein